MTSEWLDRFTAQGRRLAQSGFKKKKAGGNDLSFSENGSISGHFATFHHDKTDSYGDVIRPGAFRDTIAQRKMTGHPFPLCLNHDFNVIIGSVTDIGEDETGAYFSADFFDTPKAQEIRAMVKKGVLWQLSFAYDTIESKKIRLADGSTANELRKVELYEISIVLVPANPRATITDVKRSKREARNELLKYMDPEMDLQKLKQMENQALQDIGQAEAKGDTRWKEARLSALAAIRKKIAILEK